MYAETFLQGWGLNHYLHVPRHYDIQLPITLQVCQTEVLSTKPTRAELV